MGIVPYFTPSRLEIIYAPVAAELSRQLDGRVDFRTATSFDKYFWKLKDQDFDIALVHPLYYVPAVDQFDYVPLVRMLEPFKALIVVPQDSPIQKTSDLKGKIIATPPTHLPAVHLARSALKQAGLNEQDDVIFMAMKTVDACLQRMLSGSAHACVAPPFAANAFQSSSGANLRTILETVELPNLTFVVHKRVPESERARIKAAMLAWNDTANGQKLLKKIKTRRFIPAEDRDYDQVRRFVLSLGEAWLPSNP